MKVVTILARLSRFLIVFVGLLSSRIIYAENGDLDKIPHKAVASGISGMQISQILGGLLLVLFVIFWGAWLAKKLKFGSKISGNGLIKIISYLPLGTREKLILLSVGDEQILISSSPQGITHLHTLQNNITFSDDETESNDSFATQLGNLLKNKSPKTNQPNNSKRRE